MRLRHKAHGVIANVDDETGERLLGGAWERIDEPKKQAPKSQPKKAPAKQAAPAEPERD